MQSIKRYCAVIFLILGGCASVEEMQHDLDASTTPLTRSYAEMQTQSLPEGKTVNVALGKQSPVFQFEQGKSFYAAFTLPEPKAARKLDIHASLSTAYMPQASILYPAFVFLDASNQPIPIEKPLVLEDHLSGSLPVPAQTRTMVIYTTPDQIPTVYGYSENGRQWPLPHATSGNLEIELSKPYAAGYDFSTATIQDTVQPYDSGKADFFCVEKIDGKRVDNAGTKTGRLNRGHGLSMTPYDVERQVSVNMATYSLIARTQYAAPIQELTGTVYQVKGEIKAALQKNKVYQVRGVLGEDYSAVWLEDSDHNVIGNKIEVHGSAKVGIFGN